MPKGQVVPKLRSAAKTRSAVSNRARLFVNRDARGPWGRRYADLVSIFADDLGGADRLSEMKLALVRRAAAITLECERLEGDLAAGRVVDLDLLGRMTGHLRRLSETLGTDRVVKDVTPSLADVIAKYSAEAAETPAREPKPPAAATGAPMPETSPSEAESPLTEDADWRPEDKSR